MSILTDIQAHPDIGSNNAAWVNVLIAQAKQFVKVYSNLPRYPELAQGYSKSNTNPSVDLTSLDTNTLYVAVNGVDGQEITITLANCTDGDSTAAELQAQIRAIDEDHYDEVTVVYNDDATGADYYLITSGRYGEYSSILVDFDEDYKHVCQAMKLSPLFGGTEVPGDEGNDELDKVVYELVVAKYMQGGFEHASDVGIPGAGISFTAYELSPWAKSVLLGRRRFF